MTTAQRLVSDDLVKVIELMREADSIELKLTVPDSSYRSAATVLGVDPLEAQIRQVYFFDTPDLRLDAAGVVARARRVQGRGDDTVVKLRPVVPSELPADVRRSPELVVEVDAMPGGYVCSASLKHRLGSPDVRAAVAGQLPLRKLFSKAQRAFFAAHAPDGVVWDDLAVLGPIFVLKLRLRPEGMPRKLVAEMWMYPDGTRVVELSTKCLPGEGVAVALETRRFLERRGIPLTGEQQTKTRTALTLFSEELRMSERIRAAQTRPQASSGVDGTPPSPGG